MRAGEVFARRMQEAPGFHLAHATWTPPAFEQVRIGLRPSPETPARARDAARDLLVEVLSAAQLADVLLLLSELVTNAIRHPVPRVGEEVTVHVAVAPGCVRGEVCDCGPGFDAEALQPPLVGVPGGRGLQIVDHVASRWGSCREELHCIWFELDR
jgi:signal transduction histidine kinase